MSSPTNPFDSAKLKVERAEQHIAECERLFNGFVEANAETSGLNKDIEVRQSLSTTQLPRFLPFAIADAIHNLRTALDHANWELRGLDGGKQNRYTNLPMRETRNDYESLCDTIETPTGDLPAFFKSLEFFKDGRGRAIYFLHSLDIEDKHIVPIQLTPGIVFADTTIRNNRGEEGLHLVNVRMVGRSDALFHSEIPLQMEHNTKLTVEICFGEVEGFNLKPILPTLLRLTDTVKNTIRDFELLVQART